MRSELRGSRVKSECKEGCNILLKKKEKKITVMETGNPCPVSQAEPVTEGTNREQCLSRLKLASLDINSQIWVAGAEKKICVTHINPFIPEVV